MSAPLSALTTSTRLRCLPSMTLIKSFITPGSSSGAAVKLAAISYPLGPHATSSRRPRIRIRRPIYAPMARAMRALRERVAGLDRGRKVGKPKSGVQASRADVFQRRLRRRVECMGHLPGQRRPAPARHGTVACGESSPPALVIILECRDDRVCELVDVVRLDEPAGLAVVDDLGGAEAVDRDRGQAACHAPDVPLRCAS